MTKVAAAGQLPMSSALHFGLGPDGGDSKISATNLKRKTPSELRVELLQQKNLMEFLHESPPVSGFMRKADGMVSEPKKSDSSKEPRFTRIDEHYPVTKTGRLPSRKKIPKGVVPSKCPDNLDISGLCSDSNAKHQLQNSCLDETVASKGCYDTSDQTNDTSEKCTYSTFKSVRDLSLGGAKLNGSTLMDMGKALKGLVSCEPHTTSAPNADDVTKAGNTVPQSFCPELQIPGQNVPLDLTLKTNMRLLCSSSVDWLHRRTNCATSNILGLSSLVGCANEAVACSSEPTSTTQVTKSATFHSWVHPQSSLPTAVISALISAPGGQGDFLSKRQQAWEDSFRSLYYMLRKKHCKIFYVCTMQFVAMFTASNGPQKIRCNAYISQSTRNLRSHLKEHDIPFSMPLCNSKFEDITAEDLAELSEIEKCNLGQARALESLFGIDSTPQSLLMFSGNKSVHALYDFLLNYRSFFTSLTSDDVPVLYSPVPFENAALTSPEVRCKQVLRVDSMASQLKGSNTDVNSGICYSVEIKDAYLPPWIISGICNAVCSKGSEFQASFATEPTSMGLNLGLDKNGYCFDISNTASLDSLQQHPAFLRGLKYGDSSYTGFLSEIGRSGR
ncbi:uncharacterized protein LOC127266192 [Andrographis paniculata]|uniref:uncharacterized protein LOC127266192 n=1 Tax=Andrographis paniculata TaxID=175694 RepID=UPI0021E88F62|nr:uncharacterized protein LOC127266192 [Andrographis paniculata]XP_051152315.1 uncharacterized protein LOC127266192 [Andrographis paniculata]XP_051152316.1 uncharacterized protein LOC127266192 [Andrographis paniculata]XP_051152317.1 uncharacterized protein LOC127266192 [Andrographis paniculata]